MSEKKKFASIRDVAREAGVSVAAVSKALNNKPDISDDLRKRIFEVCEQLGYRLNSGIQDLVRRGRNGRTMNVGFVIVGKEFADPAYARAIDGVARGARECNLNLMLERLRGDEASQYDLPPALRDSRVDGVVITGELNENVIAVLRKMDIPFVILGVYDTAVSGSAVSVEPDIRGGMALLVAKLKENGARRIAFFTENPDNFSEANNFNHFKSALSENGLEFDEALLYTGAGNFSGAYATIRPVFMRTKLPFDAIVALDYRTAQEISVMIMARCGLNRPPKVTIGLVRPFDYYHLPVPAIYLEGHLDSSAYEGMKILWTSISEGEELTSKKIVMHPVCTMELVPQTGGAK